ncbi:MAG: nucleoside triphosphate pyrophosphohydrolase [Oscillospiraceae bacterium]
MEFKEKGNYNFDDLLKIMNILRSPGGCMWDGEQTHKSIRQNVIEEAYEVAEGIDKDSPKILCEELGDLLLQVVFHAEISKGEGKFDINSVCDGICKKLILRHPHIFGDIKVSNSDEILDNWEKIKKQEKGQQTAIDTVKAVPITFPALMRSQKVQKRAAKSGFDYPDAAMALEALEGEIEELKLAIKNDDMDNQFEELGDILFSTVNVARFLKIDSELALTRSCEKFIDRFERVEKLADEENCNMKNADINELNDLWKKAKNTGI